MPRRSILAHRPISTKIGWLSRADGSSQFAFGTQVSTASVTGPIEVRMRDELTDRATFQVIISPLDGYAGIPATALSAELRDMFQSVILLHHHPRSLIQVTIQTTGVTARASQTIPISLDGHRYKSSEEAEPRLAQLLGPDHPYLASEIATSINASMLALMDANIPICSTILACACAILDEKDVCQDRDMGDHMMEDSTACLAIDPTPQEEEAAQSVHVVAFSLTGYDPINSTESHLRAQLAYISSVGRVSSRDHKRVIQATKDAVFSTFERIREAFVERFE